MAVPTSYAGLYSSFEMILARFRELNTGHFILDEQAWKEVRRNLTGSD